MKSTNTKGFTLVELIIVITILAILATIAFISFQGYAGDSRNTKRSSDLASIATAMEVKMAESVSILNFASNTGSNANVVLAGGASTGTTYKAGDINFTVLGANTDQYKDPSAKVGYKIGVTSLAGGVYQLASQKEVDGTKKAYVMGTYKPRSATATGTVGFFKVNDLVEGTATGTITAIASDLSTVTVGSTGSISVTGLTLSGSTDESAGLIKETGNGTGIVTDNGTLLPY